MNAFKRYTKLLFCSAGFVGAALLAGCGGGSDDGRDPILGVPSVELQSLTVTPATASVAIGATQQFVATASYADGSSRDVSASASWTTATPAVASVNASTGLATGVAAGNSVISAALGTKTASATLTVSPATIVALAVTPQAISLRVLGTSQLVVVATYSDGSTADVSASAVFSSASPNLVTTSSTGLLSGVAAGSSVVTASFGGFNASTTATVAGIALTAISVTPATAGVIVGGVQQFIATATYSDGSNQNITGVVLWKSSDSAVATVVQGGAVTGLAVGVTTISATSGPFTGSGQLTVTATTPPAAGVAVNLNSAASFAVLAGTSLTSAAGGTTLISGDVGAFSQTVQPLQAAGYTNYSSGAVLTTALADLQSAITDANMRNCDVDFTGNIDLGGLTLPPGVYCYSGTIRVTGTLTLSGAGVYIFRTPLTFNTTANSVVQLLNGATAANVNWVPVGATTLGANSALVGNVLGQSAAITVGDNTTLLNGRVLSGAAVTLSNNQIAK